MSRREGNAPDADKISLILIVAFILLAVSSFLIIVIGTI